MNRWSGILSVAIGLAASQAAMAAPPADIPTVLNGVRHSLILRAGHLEGDGAPILLKSISQAEYIAVGEDHYTQQVPAFVSALCDILAPQALSALALEIGPVAATALTPILAAPDRESRMVQFVRRYPAAVTFLDGRADNAMAAHCLASGRRGQVRLLGLDQEYIGSAGFLLDRILATPLKPTARRAIVALREQESANAAKAKQSGDPSFLLLLSISSTRLNEVAALLAKGGDQTAVRLFDELRESAAIYALNHRGDPAANTRRATLLKRHLAVLAPAQGKVLLKFGDWHIYKGINPLGNRDLGNFVAERADGSGRQSLHILILGAKGVHAAFAGYARAPRQEPFVMTDDPDYKWMKAVVDQQLAGGWTLFDLRELRRRSVTSLDPDWARVINGYDLMVLVPEITPTETFLCMTEPTRCAERGGA